MTDENGTPIIETPREVRNAVHAVQRQRWTEGLLAIVVAVLVLSLVGVTAWNTARLRNFSHDQAKAQEFGLKAINCILDNFAEHRWSNQVFHDSLGDFLKSPRTPHTPLPNLPTEQQFHDDCAPFNQGREVVPPTTPRPGQ